MKHKIAGIIPARYGSRRLPQKMLADVNGKSLIQLTYENAQRVASLDTLAVATDHRAIYNHVIAFGGHAVMTSLECSSGSERLAEAIVREPFLAAHDAYVNIQGDEPTIAPETIEAVIETLLNAADTEVATAVTPIVSEEEAHDSSVVKCVINANGRALYFSRGLIPYGHEGRYLPDTVYYRHLGIYAYTGRFLSRYPKLAPSPLQQAEELEQLKILEHGYTIQAVVVKENSHGIDTQNDLERLRTS